LTRISHILVVDDDKEIRTLVSRSLERDGFRTSSAGNGVEMAKALEKASIDLIVLDIMLPGKDGLALCRDLRARNDATPIILLTAKGEDVDRVVGLEMGADDYLPKPFNSRELIARIKAVLRRASAPMSSALSPKARFAKFSNWKLDIMNRELIAADGSIVSLSASEFDLLVVFTLNPQSVLSRDQLLDIAKGRAAALFDRSIDIQVSRLRKKIEVDPKEPKLIKTVRGGGYLFASTVEMT